MEKRRLDGVRFAPGTDSVMVNVVAFDAVTPPSEMTPAAPRMVATPTAPNDVSAGNC